MSFSTSVSRVCLPEAATAAVSAQNKTMATGLLYLAQTPLYAEAALLHVIFLGGRHMSALRG